MGEWYEEWFNDDYLHLYAHRDQEEADRQVQKVIALLQLNGSERILDLACGAGRHVKALYAQNFSVMGIDLSPILVEQARQNTEATIEQRDMRHLTGLGTFDLVTSFFTSFGYLPTPKDDVSVLEAVYQILRPKGRLFMDLVDPHELQLVPEEKCVVNGQAVSLYRYRQNGCMVKEIHFPNRSYREAVRLYTKTDLEDLCRQAGLIPHYWEARQGRQWLVARR